MGQLNIMDQTGDTKQIWDTENADEVCAARDLFQKLTGKNYKAFAVKKDGEKGKEIKEFDPDAGKIILVPPMAAG